MGPSSLKPRSEFAERAGEWVAAGLISSEQRDAIYRFETDTSTTRRRAAGPDGPGALTMVAEVAGYLSGAVAVVGGVAIVGPRWGDLPLVARLAIAASIAIVGLAVGVRLVRSDDRGAARLGGFIWLIAVGGLALSSAVIADRLAPDDDRWVALVAGTTVAIAGAALWRNLDRPLQMATFATGVIAAASALGDLAGVPQWTAALVAWGAGAAFGGVVALGRLRPRSTGFVVAAVVMTTGAFQLASRFERAAAILAVATAAAIVAIALVERSLALLGVGLVAFVAAVAMLMSTVVEGTVSRTIAVAFGLATLTLIGARAQRLAAR